MKGRINAEDSHVSLFKDVILSYFQNTKNEDIADKNRNGRSGISTFGIVVVVK
jgi:hypothetical protein